MGNSITLVVDIPESLYSSLSDFLEAESSWDFNQVFSAALSQFLRERHPSRLSFSSGRVLSAEDFSSARPDGSPRVLPFDPHCGLDRTHKDAQVFKQHQISTSALATIFYLLLELGLDEKKLDIEAL